MKLYIIITLDIHPIGGMQLYTAGKAAFLEKNGWKVVVLYPGSNDKSCAVSSLNKYTAGGNLLLDHRPAQLSGRLQHAVLKKICRLWRDINTDQDLIYIESQSEVTALWGELLAEKLRARHVCFNCNELFRGPKKYYEENIEFFRFKYDRKELLGLPKDTLQKIFDGYMEVPCDDTFLFDAVEPGPIQDVRNEFVEDLAICDWNIAYVGRAEKGYVSNIIKGVADFAEKYSEKRIGFIMVGNAEERKEQIQEVLERCSNLNIELPGDMVPIPRDLYRKLDVVIAGAVCAEISAREGVPTIVADCENHWACGVLGYTTMNSMYHETGFEQSDFCEALEDTLIHKTYLKHVYAFPEAIPSDEIYESHFLFFEGASKRKVYYDVKKNPNVERLSQKEKILVYLKLWNPNCFFKLSGIKKRLCNGSKRAGCF